MSTNRKKDFAVFRNRLSKIRNYYGDNVTFANAIGLHRQTVGAYLNGDRVPDIITLQKIARKLGVSADWLLGLSNAKTPDATVQSASDYTGLSEDSLNQIKAWTSSSYTYGYVLDLLIKCCADDIKVFYELDAIFRYARLLSFDSSEEKLSSKEQLKDYQMREEVEEFLKQMPSHNYVLITREEFISSLRSQASRDFETLMDRLESIAKSDQDRECVPILSDEDLHLEQLEDEGFFDDHSDEESEKMSEEEKLADPMRKTWETIKQIHEAKEESLKPNSNDN